MATVPRIAAVSCFSTMPLIYGVRHAGNLRAELLLSDPEEVIREFSEHRADIALVPFWAVPSLAGAKIVTEYCVGGVPAAWHALLAAGDPLLDAWREAGAPLPFAFAVWVARPEVDPDRIGALQQALTFGLEHGYEALLDSEFAPEAAAAYELLDSFDYIFDNQKHKALQQFWDSGLKVAPRANPG